MKQSHKSKLRYRDIVEDQTELICRHLPDGTITFVNEAYCQYFGQSREDLVGKQFLPLIPEDARGEVQRHFASLCPDTPVLTHEHKVLLPNGEIRWNQWTNRALLDQDRRVVEIQGTGRDITERKLAEETLEIVRNKLTILQRGSLKLGEAHGVDDLCRQAVLFAHEELGISRLGIWFLGDDEGLLLGSFGIDESGQLRDEREQRNFDPNLSDWMQTSQESPACAQVHRDAPLYNDRGEIVGQGTSATVGIWDGRTTIGMLVADDFLAPGSLTEPNIEILSMFAITLGHLCSQKQAEGALRQSELNLKKAQKIAKLGSWHLDIKTRELECSDETYRILGIPLGQPITEEIFFQCVHPDDQEEVGKLWAAALQGESFQIDYRILVQGQEKWVHEKADIEFDAQGNLTGFRGVGRDITERIHAEIAQKSFEGQLRQAQKMEAIGTLAGGIAHDFNNILQAICSFTELAQCEIPEDSKAQKFLQRVLEGGQRATDLVGQILTFSRQREQTLRPLKVQIILGEALKLLRGSLPTTIKICVNIDKECGTILADPSQIHQVIMNLCTNAYHAMREKGGVLEVRLKERKISPDQAGELLDIDSGEYLALEVKDTGCGMTDEVKEHILEPFFTTKKADEGTGMGLATVHGIVMSHGGSISVQSKVGEGTTFEILLPLHQVNEEVRREKSNQKNLPVGNENILFVDDEEAIVEQGRIALERLGYHVTPQTSSVEALTLFQSQPDAFDIVITDLTMPNMTGLDLAKALLQTKPNLPILLCSGYSEQIGEEKFAEAGISKFALKPILLRQMAALVREILDTSRAKNQS